MAITLDNTVMITPLKTSVVGTCVCVRAALRPYQPFTGHDAGEVDHLQMGRLGDQRVRRQGDDVVAYPR